MLQQWDVYHSENGTWQEIPASYQRWLQMQIKRSWKAAKPAGVLVGRMEGFWSRTTSEPTASALLLDSTLRGSNCGSSPNVALTRSFKKVNYRNVIKQLCGTVLSAPLRAVGLLPEQFGKRNRIPASRRLADSSRLRPISWDLSLEISGADSSLEKAQHYSSRVRH